MSRFPAALLLAIVVLAGCGGSPDADQAEKALTVPAYGPYPSRDA